MAIDTAAKRRSVAHIATRGFFGAGVTPDAAKPQFWRQCVARVYGGILSGGAAVIEAIANNPLICSVGRMMSRR